MIELSGVTKTYGSQTVVDAIDLALPQGKLTAIVGPNGAGKSTLFSIAARLLSPDAGAVHVDGMNVATAAADQVARRLAVLRQDNTLAARLSVVDLIRFGRFPHSAGRLTDRDHEAVAQAMAYMELEPFRDRYLDELSGGQRQRAFIAMVLAQDTDYVLLDEPLNNLDMRHSVQMMRRLRALVADLGKTIALVLHDVNFAAAHADHIVALREGAIVAQGTPEQVITPEVLKAVYDMEVQVVEVGGQRVAVYFR